MIDSIAKLRLPVNVVGIIASAENMINEASMKPDDVFTALNGETVEMLNSDAEGRMVLGDAVFYATIPTSSYIGFCNINWSCSSSTWRR